MAPPKLLILCQHQFGYHSDTYYYCRHLSQRFTITYLCWNYGQKKMTIPGITVIYVSRKGNLAVRNLRYICRAVREIKKGYAFQFIKYFRGASLLPLLSRKTNFLMDIRSASVLEKKSQRIAYNLLMKLEIRAFSRISVISESLAKKLNLTHRAFVLPLGADIISNAPKTFYQINLLYVGTLYNRKLHRAVNGFSRFYAACKDKIPMKFTIIGTGFSSEEKDLKALVEQHKLSKVVHVIGQVPHDELKPFFDSHNIGLSFIPQTAYFDAQPPTKNYEYMLSGMPVIATRTLENQRHINRSNGVLIEDTSTGMYNGLIELYHRLHNFNADGIRSAAMPHTWANITADLADKLMNLILEQKRIK